MRSREARALLRRRASGVQGAGFGGGRLQGAVGRIERGRAPPCAADRGQEAVERRQGDLGDVDGRNGEGRGGDDPPIEVGTASVRSAVEMGLMIEMSDLLVDLLVANTTVIDGEPGSPPRHLWVTPRRAQQQHLADERRLALIDWRRIFARLYNTRSVSIPQK